MNWNKALNLLISIFIVVNILLGITNYNKHIKVYRVSHKQVDTIVSLLGEKGIIIDDDLPIEYAPLAPVKITPLEFTTTLRDTFIKAFLNEDLSQVMITKETIQGGQHIVYKFEGKEISFIDNEVYYTNKNIAENTKQVSEQAILRMCEHFVEQIPVQDIYEKVKITHKIESYHGDVTYYELYNGFPLFNSYITMQVNAQGVYSAQMKLVTQEGVEEKAQPIYPINRVLFELFNSGDYTTTSETIEVRAIDRGYMIPDSTRVHLLEEEAIPVYKIQIKGLNRPLFVNAYTNKLVK